LQVSGSGQQRRPHNVVFAPSGTPAKKWQENNDRRRAHIVVHTSDYKSRKEKKKMYIKQANKFQMAPIRLAWVKRKTRLNCGGKWKSSSLRAWFVIVSRLALPLLNSSFMLSKSLLNLIKTSFCGDPCLCMLYNCIALADRFLNHFTMNVPFAWL